MTSCIFNDPIHGTIELEGILVSVIDTPEFQRLRNIKQLGVGYYVYPGATHNRFEHSIGVCHLAGKMIDKLAQQVHISSVDKICVKIAALLHDLGHGPFSHLFENSFIDQISRSSWSHELQSCRILDRILEKHDKVACAFAEASLTDIDIVFIKELINAKDYTCQDGWLFKGRPKEKGYLYEVVANERTGIDVDKFDYLMRDCYHLGVNCTLDWRRLVSMMRVVEKDGQLHIAIRDKERDNVFNMFYLRMHLHKIAYQHATVISLDLMIGDILRLCDSVLYPDMKISDTINNLDRYLTLTDFILEQISLLPHCNRDPANLEQAQEIINRVKTRRLYTLIGETPPSTRDFKEHDKLLTDITCGDNELRNQIALSVLRLNFGKWGKTGDPVQAVLFYDKTGNLVSEKLYHEESLFVPRSWSQKQLRVYCRSEDPTTIELAKRKFSEWLSRTFL